MIKVSDHAVVRYLERQQGVDVEAIRQTIASSLDCRSARIGRVGGAFPSLVQTRPGKRLAPNGCATVRGAGHAGNARRNTTGLQAADREIPHRKNCGNFLQAIGTNSYKPQGRSR